MSSLIKKGPIETKWNVNYTRVLGYYQEVWHTGLNEHKVISAPDEDILETKVEVQIAKWNEKWAAYSEKKKIEAEKRAMIKEAEQRTKEAQDALAELENILIYTLDVDDAINEDMLLNKDTFKEPRPKEPTKPEPFSYPPMPDKNSPEYTPKLSLLSKIIKPLAERQIKECELRYSKDMSAWEQQKQKIDEQNAELEKLYQKELKEWENKVQEWEQRKSEFFEKQRLFNENIHAFLARYREGDVPSIMEYCSLVLKNSVLPSCIKKNFEIEYIPETKILIVEYMLPTPDDLPKIKEVKYIQSKNELKEIYYTDSFLERLYDSTIYRLLLRIIHELFEADTASVIDAISVNGWVDYINKATGKNELSCIASIQVKKEEFKEIDLRNVDPKACFKSLKGVGSSKLAGITPIQPILQINKNDRRFIQSYDVANNLDASTNLAAIDWEDFEHLIRELFEKEFSSYGGEVKVTQASRDGGVDVIAFDPDPIRGGKIVIQAKRYTNVVGVAAVRDLYGTVVNEGAT
ncbi:MAG: restriction endonuclease, partial [Firmicutes bacterium]|nr:restriction endonuclease [Bacillota bacterium]